MNNDNIYNSEKRYIHYSLTYIISNRFDIEKYTPTYVRILKLYFIYIILRYDIVVENELKFLAKHIFQRT
jgi:hypothetical protein